MPFVFFSVTSSIGRALEQCRWWSCVLTVAPEENGAGQRRRSTHRSRTEHGRIVNDYDPGTPMTYIHAPRGFIGFSRVSLQFTDIQQILWRRQRAARRQLRRRRGRGARARRRERRRQVHAAEDPGRASSSRTAARSAGAASALHLRSPREAIERGIGMVYQEMLSFPNLSVSANIFRRPRAHAAAAGCDEAAMRERDPGAARPPVISRSIRTRPPIRSPPRTGSCSRSRARWPSSARFSCSTSRRRR